MIGKLRPLDYIPILSIFNAGIRLLDVAFSSPGGKIHTFAMNHLYVNQESSKPARLGRALLTAIPLINLVTLVYDLAMRIFNPSMDEAVKGRLIDAFIKKLEKHHIAFSDESDRKALSKGSLYLFNKLSHLDAAAKDDLLQAISTLTFLKALDLSFNALSTLPESMKNLTQLEDLDLLNNNLRVIPKWMKDFTKLKYLNLCGNQLSKLPDFIGHLPLLTWISLADNQFTSRPQLPQRIEVDC